MKTSILFAMRYGDDVGFVWNTIARVRDLAAGFLQDDYDCYVAYPRLTGQPAQSLQNLQRIELDCYDMGEAGLARLQAQVAEKRVTVLVYMSALPSTLKLDRLRAMGLRTVNTENDSFDHRERDPMHKAAIKLVWRRWLHRQLHDVHIANARSQARYLLEHYKLPQDHLCTVVNGVDCDRFRPADTAQAEPAPTLPAERLWLLSVGQARSEKRVEWTIRAVQRLRAEFPHLPFGFAYLGDGPELPRWRGLVEQAGLQDDVVFLGAHGDTAPFYRSAALLVHAAQRESFGLAVVEAMASGLPVVATAAAGPSETIEQDVTGTLVGLSDEEAYYRAIVRYLQSPELRRRHGAKGRERALALYSINRQAREYAEVIRRCDAARRPAQAPAQPSRAAA
ncbi:MAG: glycosyltransferase family 4 protein [Hydrogenophaga sp.]|nr:glycosyltransferase family 4 protein [Hydrogenophaga sp.]